MKAKLVLGSLAVAGLLLLGACGKQAASSGTSSSSSSSAKSAKIMAVGSTALQPLVEQAAKDFQKENTNITVNVQGGGSGTGLSQVAQGSVAIGNSDIFAETKDGVPADKLTDHRVAVVGMAPVANPEVGVKSVTMAQLKDIFTGKIKNWKEVGGKDEAITVINRAEGSGTRATFEAAVLDGAKAVKSQEQDSNGTVQQIVRSTPGAISYLAFSYFKSDIQPLAIDGVKPTEANVTTNKWQIWSYEHMYTQKKIDAATKKFLAYMETNQVQNGAVKKLGYISIHDMKVTKDAQNKVSEK
ncbi:phosphate ABC transporter substrate-binding protein PstS family protein [Lapidilactobacillus gannanensis]|jgi:phosphate transport system substrate-binding protein|uniref:Phosphate-binding protein n=1 Tax=Lapidilactobacillus gannanensis TaxID=2486002 RepID=A0ABW4BLN4_9LACO|nr:phosphate ABC transporter substrate-binding protein PstS family protein [Lapidilactobacillus gannanensis]MCH4057017.1 phosphate ABC transporter substrate-binding protein PstS family protein [Lactobacillaceae bacterium]